MSSSGDRDPSLLGVASVRSGPGAPAAGADWSNVPGVGKTPLCVRARLVASATVANRTPQLVVTDGGGNTLFFAPAAPAQTAGQTVDYCWYPGAPITTAAGAVVLGPMPALPLAANWTVGTVTGGLQAGDQWSALNIVLAG